MRIHFNWGMAMLLMSCFSELIGKPVWFSWWVYFLLCFVEFDVKKGDKK